MGIPFYFGEIIAKSPASKRFNIVADKLPKTCSRFFLDFNSIIHPCSAQAVAKLSKEVEVDDSLYNQIFSSITNYTINLIDIVNPSDLVYIAIDGVAPRAKMHQQRKRRYLSAQRNKQITQFKLKNGIPNTKWDSNCITPGTEFMRKLDIYLETTFKDMVSDRFPDLKSIVVSGSSEPGEGEHKMIHYIKKHQEMVCDVIYGLDADLIMLALTTHSSSIVLMRESQDFGSLSSNSNTPFKYLVVENLRESVCDRLQKNNKTQQTVELDTNQLINDYVFMCFMLGNDFIPSLSFLKIKEGAVDVLLDCYHETCGNDGLVQHPTEGNEVYTINLGSLTKFISALKKQEDDLMVEVIDRYMRATPKPQRNFNTILQNIKYHNPKMTLKEVQDRAVREFSFDLEEYPLRNKMQVDIDPSNDKKWRNAYYHYIFGSHALETVHEACNEYVQGLLWTANYYFDQSACQSWYYHYHYAPCASDLQKYLMSLEDGSIQTQKNNLLQASKSEDEMNYDPAHLQLLLVLPPDSLELLPFHLRPIMTNFALGCVRFYPVDFRVQTFLKHKMWECTPLIPNIDVQLVIQQLHDQQN